MNKVFYVGMYIRLSKEDLISQESVSVQNQRKMILEYCRTANLDVVKEYVDDGFTGTNFNRPAFKEMLEDIQSGLINCVVVKDLSRFGRDYIDAGYYLDRFFPNNNIRFISISDNMDTIKDDGGMITPIKNVINHYYSVDISKKVLNTFKVKQKNGEFIGAFTSYGYKKDPNNRNKLLIDTYPATIVKKIFELYLNGNSKMSIAKYLNANKVLCPSEYKKSIGQKYRNCNRLNSTSYWTYSTINNILNNRIYVGDMVQGKTQRRMNRRNTMKSKDDWIIVENTHTPIITRDEWEQTQKLLKIKTRNLNFNQNLSIFRGFIKCAECGRAMRKKKDVRGVISYNCGTDSTHGAKMCKSHYIAENKLIEIVKTDINEMLRQIKNLKEIIASTELLEDNLEEIKKDILTAENEIEKLKALRVDAYTDYKDGLISSKQEYLNIINSYELKEKKLVAKIVDLENLLQQDNKKQKTEWIEYLAERNEILELDRNVILELIELIEVTAKREIIITYKFSNDLKEFL